MPTRFKRLLSIVAVSAIAMHTVLWGGTPARGSEMTVDPFSVICHSGGNTDTAPDQRPANPAPSHVCDHCTLCGSTPQAAASPATVVIQVLSSQPSYVLEPTPATPRGGVEVALKGARGPPVLV